MWIREIVRRIHANSMLSFINLLNVLSPYLRQQLFLVLVQYGGSRVHLVYLLHTAGPVRNINRT